MRNKPKTYYYRLPIERNFSENKRACYSRIPELRLDARLVAYNVASLLNGDGKKVDMQKHFLSKDRSKSKS